MALRLLFRRKDTNLDTGHSFLVPLVMWSMVHGSVILIVDPVGPYS